MPRFGALETRGSAFSQRLQCSGGTRYETAMGGRGTRSTFEGAFDLTDRHFPGVPSMFEGAIANGIESFVSTLIPKNFRKLTQAVSTFLGSQS
ncbi:MAG: hypothetical protein QOJ64_3939 [Acidobacteriota bacterium]|nr:hypothetical protein [Acidobacteriota bacterium]